ncbi:hypothetical protein [Plantibacter sp. YIM 135347]|uniref:hypothetical protein n=1 Tax=Plantibacter sp. YIM 135347 TaxID=3423919 RepID=UPI003D353E48
MQLGTRWSVGQQTPDTLPQAVVDAVRAEEAELVSLGVETSSWRWTLTWLERRPIVELDDGTTIRIAADGSVVVTRADEAAEDADDD